MKKLLFISGSYRNGNCKEILEEIEHTFWLEYSCDLVYIRDFSLEPCIGCDACQNNNICSSNDKMDILLDKVYDADIVILATPNYFYNVSSLTKNFIDKTLPCYYSRKLHGKKFIYIYTGNDEAHNTKKYLDSAMHGFTICHGINLLGSYAYSADGIGEFSDINEKNSTTQTIISLIRQQLAN